MTRKEKRLGLSLAELLVVIAAVAILCMLLLPAIPGRHRVHAKIALAKSMLGQLETALADYTADHGAYPPEKTPALDKPSETLYFYLVGMDISSPNKSNQEKLRRELKDTKVYFEFMRNYLEDYDNDGNYEVVDPWGRPWIYVRGDYDGEPGTSRNAWPLHNGDSYDLYSVGPDGRTGTPTRKKKWKEDARTYEYAPDRSGSFYLQAADEYEDGMDPDDIANF